MKSKRAVRWRSGVAAGLAAAGLGATPARASAEGILFGDGGVYLGYTFGADRPFVWGLQGHLGVDFTGSDHECDDYPPGPTAGGLIRLGFHEGIRRPHLAFAGEAGVLFHEAYQTTGELGVALRMFPPRREGDELRPPIREPWISPHVAASLSAAAANLWFDYHPLFQEATAALAARLPWHLQANGTCYVVGRVLHGPSVDDAETAAVALFGDRTREHPAQGVWSRRMGTEYASVSSFVQLAAQLQAVGAPELLVDAALRAARDEQHHTELCRRVLRGLGADRVIVEGGSHFTRPSLRGEAAWIRLAVESWGDGCLGEGWAAACAALEAHHAEDDGVRSAERRIAEDEARHQALAFQVLTFALANGGEAVREALRAARHAPVRGEQDLDDTPELERFGCLSRSKRLRALEQVRELSLLRLQALLG